MAELGDLHRFMAWQGSILTDSGGFQVFSLAELNRITDEGVTFKSHVDGSIVHLTPQRSIEVQNALGADIIMAFDECPAASAPAEYHREAVEADAAVGRAMPRRPPAPGRSIAFCDRTRWDGPGAASPLRPEAGGDELPRLRHRRPGGGRRLRGNEAGTGGCDADVALRSSAVPDGRGFPAGYCGRRWRAGWICSIASCRHGTAAMPMRSRQAGRCA